MRSIFALSITFFLLIACSPTQVTATLPPTSTPLPIPTGKPVPTATFTVIPTPTAEKKPAQIWAERPIKDYSWCKDATKFDEFFVPMEELQDRADFVQASLTPDLFDPAKFAKVSDYRVVDKYLIPSPFDNPPHYTAEGSAPFLKDYMCGMTEIDGKKYFVTQVPQYVEGVPASEWPVITGLFELRSGTEDRWPIAVDWYKNRMNLVAWDVTDLSLATKFVNPETGVNFSSAEVNEIVEEMKNNNFARTHNLVFKIKITDAEWYR